MLSKDVSEVRFNGYVAQEYAELLHAADSIIVVGADPYESATGCSLRGNTLAASFSWVLL
jgi:hypothetical protein